MFQPASVAPCLSCKLAPRQDMRSAALRFTPIAFIFTVTLSRQYTIAVRDAKTVGSQFSTCNYSSGRYLLSSRFTLALIPRTIIPQGEMATSEAASEQRLYRSVRHGAWQTTASPAVSQAGASPAL